MASGSKWTPSEDAMLRDASAQGWSVEKTLDLLPGRSVGAIVRRMDNLDIPGTTKFRRIERLSMSPEAKLRRAQYDKEKSAAYHKAAYSQPEAQYKERHCLKCRKRFMSWGPGNRLCVEHRHADAYEMI